MREEEGRRGLSNEGGGREKRAEYEGVVSDEAAGGIHEVSEEGEGCSGQILVTYLINITKFEQSI